MPVGEAPPTHEAAPITAHERARFPWPCPAPPVRDLVVAAVATLGAMGIVLWLGRDLWFAGGAWDLLFGGGTGGLLAPHHGHLDLPAAAVHLAARRAAGFEFWPWHPLVRVVGYGAMTYVMWLVLRRRGTDPAIGWIALGGLLLLGPSASLAAPDAGLFVVVPVLALAASLLDVDGPARPGDRGILAGLLLVMAVSGPVGLSAVAAVLVVAAASGRLWLVTPGLAAVAAGYGAWLAWQGGWAQQLTELTVDEVAALPRLLWDALGAAVAQAAALPAAYGPVLAVALVAFVVVLGMRRRLGRFDAVWLAAAAGYVAVAALTGVAATPFDPSAAPHVAVVGWLLVPAVVPHLGIGGEGAGRTAVLWAAALLVVVGSLGALDASLDRAADEAAALRHHVEDVARLLAVGEPAVADSPLVDGGPDGDSALTVERVGEMLAAGWDPGDDGDPEGLELARGVLRLGTRAAPATGPGCAPVGEATQLAAPAHPGGFVLSPEEPVDDPVVVRIRYTDEHGAGVRTTALTTPTMVAFPTGAGGDVTVSAVGPITALELCPVEGAGG